MNHALAWENLSFGKPDYGMESVLAEFRRSAIPDRLTVANVEWVEGDSAVALLTEQAIAEVQRNTSYVTAPAKQILKRYEFASAGGWNVFGTTIEGGLGSVAYFKPKVPRLDFERHKRIKYETPQKEPALPILPFVDEETANEIYEQHGVTPVEGESFWRTVRRFNLPIAICEGFKKALSLIAQGLPAIALRGITQWHKKGTLELHEVIAAFATFGRKIFVIFDQDEKASTQLNVRQQATKLGHALEIQGCQVFLPTWDRQLGKGIDDVLFNQGTDASSTFQSILKSASTLGQYRRGDRLDKAIGLLERLNVLSYPIEHSSEGEYLPPLPGLQPSAIHVLAASMNAGKTTRIGADWVKEAISWGWNVLVLAPLNSLGEQTAQNWQLPHLHTYGTKAIEQQALWAEVSHNHGIVMCPDSLHRLPEWFYSRPVLLILDEANQVIEHLSQGDTLKSRWADILERFSHIAKSAISTGAIVLSEDGIADRAVNFIKTLTDCNQIRIFTHRKQGQPWRCQLYRGQASGYRAKLLERARTARLLCVTSSRAEAKRLERALRRSNPGLRVVRIDSETNQDGRFTGFFENPDQWLAQEQPDVLILSPTAKSGVSIQGGMSQQDAYFEEVWGYFSCLSTDTHLQLLGRFRPGVPRVIFCPDFLMSSGDESLLYPRAIQRRFQRNAKALAGVYEIEELLSFDEQSEQRCIIERAVLDYLSQAKAVSGAQKMMAHVALQQRLEASGHYVISEQLSGDREISDFWKAIQEELWQEEAQIFATTEIDPEIHTLEWAKKTLDSLDVSLKTRTCALKVLRRREFPGIEFDDPEECYQALFKDNGALRRGVLLQAQAENLEAAKESDREAVERVLKGTVRPLHRLPKASIRANLIARTGLLSLLDGSVYDNQDARAILLRQEALKYANEIHYWLRLQIKETQTPVEIANKLLKKIGLEAVAVSRPGKQGEARGRRYRVNGLEDPVRVRLLETVRRKLLGVTSSICNRGEIPFQIEDRDQQAPQNPPSTQVAEAVREVLSALSIGQEAVQGVWRSFGLEVRVAVVSQLWAESEGVIDQLAVMVPDLFAGFELVV